MREAFATTRAVLPAAAAAAGLLLSWQTSAHEVITTKITFSKEIVRILSKNCLGCHRSGGMAPMSLATYAEARPWAKAIKEEVLERRMPPWHAAPGYNEFRNDRRLADREVDLITAWVDGGAPKGEDRDLPPPAAEAAAEWPLGKPDLILDAAKPLSTKADTADEYRTFVLTYRGSEDRWVRAVDLSARTRGPGQHAFMWIDRSAASERLDALAYSYLGSAPASAEILGAWMPGQDPAASTSGVGHLLPAGARLILQVHRPTSDIDETEAPRVGLYFGKGAPRRIRELVIGRPKIEIPAGEASYAVRSAHTVDADIDATSVLPHMHRLGKSMEVTAVRPNGTREVLVWVRDYDFRWQTLYTFKRPVRLPRGTRIEVVALYDNSEKNPHNTSTPPQAVRAGSSPGDEVFAAHVTYVAR
jgi:mono/diheme cytochrome c family protein